MEQEINQELQRIETGSLEQAPPGKLQRVIFEHGQLEQALDGQRVDVAPLEDLKGALRYAIMKVGLRSANWPTDIEKGLLIQHLITHYGGHTVGEIRLAFDMAIAGKLDLKEVNCFENFSCLYFSTVMNAYRAWSKEEYKQLKQAPIALPAPEEDLSDQAMTDWLHFTGDKVRAGKITVYFIPVALYDWLDKRGEIKATGPEKFDYLARAVELRQGQLSELVNNENSLDNRNRLSAFMVMKQSNTLTGDEIGIVKNLAKKCVVYDMLKSKG